MVGKRRLKTWYGDVWHNESEPEGVFQRLYAMQGCERNTRLNKNS